MISVIVPVYNTEDYLDRCINSILHSNNSNFELILVNDGSTDNSLQICKKYSDGDARVTVINQENSGVSAARNRGLSESKGEWIVFVDSDDYISTDFFDYIEKSKYQKYDLLLFDISLSEMEGVFDWKSYEYDETFRCDLIEKTMRNLQLTDSGSTSLRGPYVKAYKKEILEKYKIRFPENVPIGEDELFNIQYYCRVQSLLYLTIPVYYYEQRLGSVTRRYKPDLIHYDYVFNRKLKEVLNANNLFSSMEEIYYDTVLSGMVHVLRDGVFNARNNNAFSEKCKVCDSMLKDCVYVSALEYNRKTGSTFRKIFLWLFQHRVYIAVNVMCILKNNISGYKCLLCKKQGDDK